MTTRWASNAEFYEKEAAFVVPYELKKDATAGPLEITASVRYAVCDSKRCLPPKTKEVSFTVTIEPAATGSRVRCASRVHRYRGTGCREACGPSKHNRREPRGLSAGRLWFRAGRDLHAVRFSYDSDHRIVLPERPRRNQAGDRFFTRDHLFVLRAWIWRDRARWSIRNRAAGFESMGQRIHRDSVRCVRRKPVGSVRDHPAVQSAHKTRCRIQARRIRGHAAHGADLRVDVVRVRRAIRRKPACRLGPIKRMATSAWHGGVRHRTRVSVLLPGGVPRLFEKTAPKRRVAGTGKDRDGVRTIGDDAEVPEQHRSGIAAQLADARALSCRMVRTCASRWRGCICLDCCDWKRRGRRRDGGDPAIAGRQRAILIFAFSLLPGMFGAPARGFGRRLFRAATGGGIGGRLATAEAGPTWLKNQYREAHGSGEAGEQTGSGELHRVRTAPNCHWMKANMFPKPEVAPAAEGLGTGRVVHRRHGPGIGSEPESARSKVRYHCDSVLRDYRSG